MTFEDAIAALGAELGFDLPLQEGVARLEASSAAGDEDAVIVSLSEMQDVGGVLLSSDVGDVASVKDLKPLLEANHIFAETAGATLSIGDGHIYFELYVPLAAIGRDEGATVVKTFVVNVRDWRRRLAGIGDAAAESSEAVSDDLQSFRV